MGMLEAQRRQGKKRMSTNPPIPVTLIQKINDLMGHAGSNDLVFRCQVLEVIRQHAAVQGDTDKELVERAYQAVKDEWTWFPPTKEEWLEMLTVAIAAIGSYCQCRQNDKLDINEEDASARKDEDDVTHERGSSGHSPTSDMQGIPAAGSLCPVLDAASGEIPVSLLPSSEISVVDPKINNVVFDKCIEALGSHDDEMNRWFLDEGNIRHFLAAYVTHAFPKPEPVSVDLEEGGRAIADALDPRGYSLPMLDAARACAKIWGLSYVD